jgi:hypothetical protein
MNKNPLANQTLGNSKKTCLLIGHIYFNQSNTRKFWFRTRFFIGNQNFRVFDWFSDSVKRNHVRSKQEPGWEKFSEIGTVFQM